MSWGKNALHDEIRGNGSERRNKRINPVKSERKRKGAQSSSNLREGKKVTSAEN